MLLRTFAIQGKFDIKIQDSDTTRYVGRCKGNICSWRITARTIEDGKTVRVNKIVKPHNCSSTAEVISSMADQAWVAEKAIGILQTEPNIGAGELQQKLKDEYDVTTGYHTVWRAKERAMDKLYGTWGQSFQNLLNFKAEIQKRSPGSIVEVDVKSEGGTAQVNFHPYVHKYYSVSMFQAAYAGEIEPITDKSQWPQVTLEFEMVPPISKRPVGRQRKLRIKGCLEDGGGGRKGKKKIDGKGKEQEDGGKEKEQEDGGKKKEQEKKRFGTTNRCKKCGELGHRKTNCPENGPRERKRKSRRVPEDEDLLSREVIAQEIVPATIGTPRRT